MPFSVNISTEDGLAEKLLISEIKYVVIFNLLIFLVWRTYKPINRCSAGQIQRKIQQNCL